MTKSEKIYDVLVVGGGASGLMAAGQAATLGAKTVVLEKMPHPARKVRITGKGRCNLTNTADLTNFIARFSPNGRFLRQAFSRFFSEDLIKFFEGIGLKVTTERGGRVFPASESAIDVVDALVRWVNQSGVRLITDTKIQEILIEGDRIAGVKVMTSSGITKNESLIKARTVIVATGGASYPATGSSGDGYRLAQQVGHTVIPARPALVPLESSELIKLDLQGLALKNVGVNLFADKKRVAQGMGEMLFTHFGVSGPIILTLSRTAVDALQNHQKVWLSIDLKPALDDAKLDARLLRDIQAHGKQKTRALLKGLLPGKLMPVCAKLCKIDPEKPMNQFGADDRKRLRQWLKDFRFEIDGHRSFAEAIVTAGGVNVKEIDPRTMASRLVPGLYFAGEVIDIDGDTGGYNLQAAFSTGWLAGRAAAESVTGSN